MTDLFKLAERLMRDTAPCAPRATPPGPIEAMTRLKQFLLGRGTLEQQLEHTGYWLTVMHAIVEAESESLDYAARSADYHASLQRAAARVLAAERRAAELERMLNPRPGAEPGAEPAGRPLPFPCQKCRGDVPAGGSVCGDCGFDHRSGAEP